MGECNIAGVLRRIADMQGDQVALEARTGKQWQEWTFSQLLANTDGFAAALHAQGVQQGDRVMLMIRPSMEFLCVTFALFHLGAVVILIDPGMGYRNLLRCIGSVRPDILVGIPTAIAFSHLFRAPFRTVRRRLGLGHLQTALRSAQEQGRVSPPIFSAEPDDLAAIIFTTGSTGPPKGVRYSHGIFAAQLALIRDFYGIGPGDVDQPGFPLFALFATALGAMAVIPDMDPTRPAQVDAAKFVQSILNYGVTYSFGSPAIWDVVSRYCQDRGITLPVRKVLMAGAPVAGELVERVSRILPKDALVYTPYGATESLPVACIEGREILAETWSLTRQGKGVCVGRALPALSISIIEPVEGPVNFWHEARQLPPGEVGEIVVQGPVVTRHYDGNEEETRLAKIADSHGFWHRMGDLGYVDNQQRLWVCGRKAHRVHTQMGVMDTLCCEAIVNGHPMVRRSALVGLGPKGWQTPVLIIEPLGPVANPADLFGELRQMVLAHPHTAVIERFLIHRSFPVDIRHNAKIFREQLTVWASKRVHLPDG